MIVVTGASGFLGRALLSQLSSEGRIALGVSRQPISGRSSHLSAPMDLSRRSNALTTQIEAVGGTHLIHAALPSRQSFDGTVGLAESQTQALDDVVIATCRIATTLQRVILVSSSAVYGPLNPDQRWFAESSPPTPTSRYGRAKLAQEQRWEQANLPFPLVVARVFNITGPNEPSSQVCGAIAAKVANSERGAALHLHNSESVRDFCDVRDAAGALLAIANAEPPSGRINICTGEGIAVSQIANLIIQASGRDVRLISDGLGSDNRSVGDPDLLRQGIGWRNRFTVQQSVHSLWSTIALQ